MKRFAAVALAAMLAGCQAVLLITVRPIPAGEREGLSVKSFGAACDGSTADDAAFATTIAEAKKRDVPVLIPPASCAYADVITLDGVRMVGQGESSVLVPLTPLRSAVMLKGSGSEVRSLRIAGSAPARGSTRESSGIVPYTATKWLIDAVVVERVAGAGIHIAHASNGVVSNSRINGTLADSIHITGQSSYVTVVGNTITNSGDDGVAVVSYEGDGGLSHHVTARSNTISDMLGGRNMSVVGGADVLYEGNRLTNNAKAACMYLSQEGSYQTFGVRSVLAQFNTITNCGNKSNGHSAVMLFSDGRFSNTLVTLYRNDIVGGPAGGVRVFGGNTMIDVESNRISNTEPPLNIATAGVTVIPYTDGPVGVP